jgi:hypothetical protein
MGEHVRDVAAWTRVELAFRSEREYDDPYLDVDVVATFRSSSGEEREVLGFWDGEDTWRVRFAPAVEGTWTWRTACSDPDDGGLHGQEGTFQVSRYQGENPIYTHGFLRVGDNQRGFVHADGTPFFWLGDTVWSMSSGITTEEWEEYLAFRRAQGYNVVQVNSLPQHDSSVADYRKPFRIDGEGWHLNRPNVAYFGYLDWLIEMTTEAGLFTAMVVLWFDYVPGTNLWWQLARKATFTPELAARYARYLSARYGAFGPIWMVTGDSDFETPEAMTVYDAAANAIDEVDPYGLLRTTHLNGEIYTPAALNEREWLDFHMFQSGHSDTSRERALTYAEGDRRYEPVRPAFNAEPMYDGTYLPYFDREPDRDVIRSVYWSGFLAGGNAGLTYGAHGIWSWSRSPISPTWRELLRLESAEDAVRLKEFFAPLPWWALEPSGGLLAEDYERQILAACTPAQDVIVVYTLQAGEIALDVGTGQQYAGAWFNPATGGRQAALMSEAGGRLAVGPASWQGDAVLLLEST